MGGWVDGREACEGWVAGGEFSRSLLSSPTYTANDGTQDAAE